MTASMHHCIMHGSQTDWHGHGSVFHLRSVFNMPTKTVCSHAPRWLWHWHDMTNTMAGQLVRKPTTIVPSLVCPTSSIKYMHIHETGIFVLLEHFALSLHVHSHMTQGCVVASSSWVICPLTNLTNSEGTKESLIRSMAKHWPNSTMFRHWQTIQSSYVSLHGSN